jgi:hypothetical protein
MVIALQYLARRCRELLRSLLASVIDVNPLATASGQDGDPAQ